MYAENRFANKRKKKIPPLPGALTVILFRKKISFIVHIVSTVITGRP